MSMQKKDLKRNRKDKNLSGLYAVTNDIAFQNGKLRKEVYGMIGKDTPFICKLHLARGRGLKFRGELQA